MTTYRLWEGDAPGALGREDADVPTLTDYGTSGGSSKPACVVCPGGGYAGLAEHEGRPIAEWFERIGVRGFVLKYRLGPRYHHPVELGDAERAMRFVRSRAETLGVQTDQIGILGFSAGGHLASTVSTHGTPARETGEPIDKVSSIPDWAVLIYPVITMRDPMTHRGSREMLLGPHPAPALVDSLSNERMVSLSTPPTFLVHGADDTVVPVSNSLDYAKALSEHQRPFELHVPAHGPHGFGMGTPGSPQDWTGLCERWLRERRVLR